MEKIHRKGLYFESKDAGNSQDSGFPRHMHEEFELYYFLEGSADYVVGEKVYPLVPYDLLLIRPAVYHFPVLHEQLPYRRIVFSFTEECVPREALPALKTADILHYAVKGLEVPYIYGRLAPGLSEADSRPIVASLVCRTLGMKPNY